MADTQASAGQPPDFKNYLNSVRQIIYHIKKPNLFVAEFNLPLSVIPLNSPLSQIFNVLAVEVPIPSTSVKVLTIPLNGIDRNFAISKDIEKQIEFTFYDDESNIFKNTIQTWMNLISFGDNVFVSFKDDYKGQLKIYALNPKFEIIRTYEFKDIFPVNIERISYSYQSENTVTSVFVTMSVDSVIEY